MIRRSLSIAALLSVAAIHAHASRPERVALVLEVSGQVVVEHGGTGVPQLLEWLPAGTRLRSHPGGYLRLMFHDGTRYELRGAARTRLTNEGLHVGPGVKLLEPLPPFPRELLAPLPSARQAGLRAAAVRVRRAQLRVLTPPGGSWVLAEEPLELGFAPEAELSDYQIEVQAPDGKVVYATHASSGSVVVPPGTLLAGRSYFWTVRGSLATGGTAQGESDFRALSDDGARARQLLLASVRQDPSDDARLVLAALEDALGRGAEAQQLRERPAHTQPQSASAPARQAPQN